MDSSPLIHDPKAKLLEIAHEINSSIYDDKIAQELDRRDELSSFRQRFHFPVHDQTQKPFLYFTGNSLGLQPKTTRKYVEQELKVWETAAVEGHFHHAEGRPWLTTDEYVLEQMCHIVGGQKEEVVIMNSLSVNLHLMMVPFYRPTKERHKIVIEARAFPSDLYAVQCQAKFHGFDPASSIVQLDPRNGELTLRTEDIIKYLEEEGDSVALVLLSGVQYYTGQFFEIEKITAAGHKKGCKVGWDLAHAVGNVVLKLHEWDVDFACWCTYKYLNSGPGNIGGAFVHSRHAYDFDLPRFGAWWAHDLSTRFQMDEPVLKPIPGAFGFRCSNPPVLCVAALLASVEIFEEAKMPRLRNKSLLLTTYLEQLLLHEFAGSEAVRIITPSDPHQRGCQLSLLFQQDVSPINEKLMAKGVLCDVRKPNVIRVSPTAMYNTFEDVRQFVKLLKEIL